MTNPLAIQHDPEAGRFSVQVEGYEGELHYRRRDGRMEIDRTAVPAPIGGRGIAGQLVKAALDVARESGWRVKPHCSYAAAYIRQHPAYADLVD